MYGKRRFAKSLPPVAQVIVLVLVLLMLLRKWGSTYALSREEIL